MRGATKRRGSTRDFEIVKGSFDKIVEFIVEFVEFIEIFPARLKIALCLKIRATNRVRMGPNARKMVTSPREWYLKG